MRVLILMYALGVAALLVSHYAEAEGLEFRPEINLASYHINPEPWQELNEFNPGLGVEASPDGQHYGHIGVYYNSDSKVGTYAGVGTKGWQVGKHVQLGGELNVVTGYVKWPIAIAPVGVVRIADRVKVLVIPGYDTAPWTVGLQVVY